MNWGKIGKYAFALLVAQITIGFIEGFFFAPEGVAAGLGVLIAGSTASFVVCGSIFVCLAAGQSSSPLTHAWATLLLQVLVASLLAWAIGAWTGRGQLSSVVLEWLVLICALLVGTAIGSAQRRRTMQAASA